MYDDDKQKIARWIAGCNDVTEEIEYVLNIAYPMGAQDKFYSHYENVFYIMAEMREVKREQIKQDNREPIDDYDAMSDAGMSNSDFG